MVVLGPTIDGELLETDWALVACIAPCRARKIARGRCECATNREWADTMAALPAPERQWVRDNLNLARA